METISSETQDSSKNKIYVNGQYTSSIYVEYQPSRLSSNVLQEKFFIVVMKTLQRNFSVTEWASSTSHDERRRMMVYEFPKNIAFTRHEIRIEQVSLKLALVAAVHQHQPGRGHSYAPFNLDSVIGFGKNGRVVCSVG